jgi:hypothetical protein
MPNPLNNFGVMPNKAESCRKCVMPKLPAVGWGSAPHSIAEQPYFTQGRIIVRSNKATIIGNSRRVRKFYRMGIARQGGKREENFKREA